MPTIWMITKWYPNREDPQLGVFIQKHAQSISLNARISVLYVHTSSDFYTGQAENTNGNLHEVVLYLKKPVHILDRTLHFFRLLKAYRKGIRLMKKVNPAPDLFHGYILLRPAMVTYLLSIIHGKKYILSEQWSGYATGKYAAKNFLSKLLSQFVVKRAAALTIVSSFLQKNMHASRLSNKHEAIIGNVIGNGTINLTKNNSTIQVLVVADLVDEIKNISGIIEMISELSPTDRKRFTLTIIGGGKDEQKLKKLANEKSLLDTTIFFTGLKSNPEVYAYLDRSDFLLMNSNFETFSAICVEAFSCGIPVIATDCGGPAEFVKPELGVLIPVNDKEQLRLAFLHMLNHVKEYDPVQIHQYAKANFSSELIGKKFLKVYENCIQNEGARTMSSS